MEEQSPQNIGKYRVDGVLGTGAMGTVYRAFDPQIERPVAIKVIRSIVALPYMDEKSCLERFKIEAKAAGALRHPNIVTLFEVNTEENPPYLVMDLIDGEGLDALIQKHGSLDPYDVMYYLYNVAQALDHAHKKGIIHRDIKPSNILIDKNHQPFILDFGVATISGQAHYAEAKEDSPVMGSPAYMSPEQILNEELDARADVFSLGVVAFEALTGVRPFEGDNFTVVAKHILKGERSSLLDVLPTFPLQADAAFERTFSRDKAVRYKDATTMILVLADTLGIKNPSAGTSEMRRYKYKVGGDSVSDKYENIAEEAKSFQVSMRAADNEEMQGSIGSARQSFGKVAPVTGKSSLGKRLLGLMLVLAGISLIVAAVLSGEFTRIISG